MTRFFDWLKAWIRDIASTNLTITTGLAEGFLFVVWALIADSFGRPLTERTMDGVSLFITMQIMGGVAQFGVKRMTDTKLQEAKAAGAATAATTAATNAAAARLTTSMPAVTQ